jgi:hypothetical protein
LPKLDFEQINKEYAELIAGVDETNATIKEETTGFIDGYLASVDDI